MIRLSTVRGHGLLPRLYFFEAVLFSVIFVAFAAIGHFIIEPGLKAQMFANLEWIGTEVLAARGDESRLKERLQLLGHGTDISIALFAADGRLLASGGREKLTSHQVHPSDFRVGHQAISISHNAVAVGSLEQGQLAAFVVVSVQGPRSPLLHASLTYIGILTLLGIGSVPIARWIVRPLQRLTEATRKLGHGNFHARADAARKDEFGDLARAFNAMADSVESLRRTEKEMLANVSHELRTPLARIRVLLELAEDDVPTVAQRYLTDISEDLTQLEQILADVITTTKLDLAAENPQYPYPPLRLTPLHVGELAHAIAAKFEREHPNRTVVKQLQCNAMLMADRVMLTHALGNILDNAQKYSSAPEAIEIASHLEQPHIVLTVKDHGIGISSEDLPNIFTPFFRADVSRTRSTGGVGLGLALTKRLIEDHGGSIQVESEVGKYTVVTVRLPAIQVESGTLPASNVTECS